MTDVKKPWDENIEIEANVPGGDGAGEAAAKLGQVVMPVVLVFAAMMNR